MAPASDWLMTAVGPPPWAIRILDREGLPAPLGKDYCAARGSGRQREMKVAARARALSPGKAGFGLPNRFSVDFTGVQKLDPEGQSLLRGPLNLFVPFAGVVDRLFQRELFANNFCFGMPASAQSAASGNPAGTIGGIGNHGSPRSSTFPKMFVHGYSSMRYESWEIENTQCPRAQTGLFAQPARPSLRLGGHPRLASRPGCGACATRCRSRRSPG